MAQTQTKWKSTLLIAVMLFVGCQSGHFRARNLPAEFRAAANPRGENLNLARLAASGTNNSLLAPGDLLEVTIATGREEEKLSPLLLRVANDGTLAVPMVGPVPIAGLETFDAGQQIASEAIRRGIYVNPLVTVDVKTKAVNRVTVLGAVEEPGVHELPRGSCDVVTALAAAGGLSKEAGTKLEVMRQASHSGYHPASHQHATNGSAEGEVQLASHQSSVPGTTPQLLRIDLADSQLSGRSELRLADRDVVMVPPRKLEVIHVAGLVAKPGQFELPIDQDIHLLDAIAMAGGYSSPVADKVFVIRRIKNRREPIVIQASLMQAKRNGNENILITAGDTISVEQTLVTTVVDTVSKVMRLTFGVAGRTTVF